MKATLKKHRLLSQFILSMIITLTTTMMLCSTGLAGEVPKKRGTESAQPKKIYDPINVISPLERLNVINKNDGFGFVQNAMPLQENQLDLSSIAADSLSVQPITEKEPILTTRTGIIIGIGGILITILVVALGSTEQSPF